MNVLVFNCGSSSQSVKVYDTSDPKNYRVIASIKARNVATRTQSDPVIEWNINNESGTQKGDLSSHASAAVKILSILHEHRIGIDAIGHRFVHGGEKFTSTTRISPGVMERLRTCFPLAPIHNPNSYSVIEVCLEQLPGLPQFAVFDTAFHASLPEDARRYAIPREIAQKYGFRKYGFHGLSCQYVSTKAAEFLGRPLKELKLVICHLGTGGSSVTAIRDGRSLDTSMGYSPLQGLVMSTRSGDIDAEIVLELVRSGLTPDEVSRMLNNQSGLIGLTGFSSNLEEVIAEAEKGNEDCRIAYEVYANRLCHYLGAFTWQLGSADAIIFTDDVGLKSWKLREKVCSGVESLGIQLDKVANHNASKTEISRVSFNESKTAILVMPTDEEQVILKEVTDQLGI